MNELKPWQFQKGNAGGPGRPKVPQSLRVYALKEGAEALLEIARDRSLKNKNRFDAIKLIYAYIYGYPKQEIDASHSFGEDSGNIAELHARLDQIEGVRPTEGVGGSESDITDGSVKPNPNLSAKRSPTKGYRGRGKK